MRKARSRSLTAQAVRSAGRFGGFCAALTALLVCGTETARADIIDQANIPASFASGQCFNTSAGTNLPLGQEFTPTLSSLQFVDLYLDDAGADIGPGANFMVNIRTGTITGPIVGTSVNTFVPDGTNTGGGNILTRFNFSSSVPLTPSSLFVIQIVQVGTIVPGNSNFLLCGDNLGAGAYPNGRAIRGGTPIASDDFWFREGVSSLEPSVPEPSGLTLLGLGALGLLGYATRRGLRMTL